MTDDKCPYCGDAFKEAVSIRNSETGDAFTANEFACQTLITTSANAPFPEARSSNCYEREIAALKAEVEPLRDLDLDMKAIRGVCRQWAAGDMDAETAMCEVLDTAERNPETTDER